MDAIVVGAGIVGLSAALELRRRSANVTVLEQFVPGHARGSSHGELRITRATYTDALYAQLVAEANREDWARLTRDAGEPLVDPWPGCFFGPQGGAIDAALRAVREAEADVVPLQAREARARFPMFRFDENELVLDDRTAGVVRAERTMRALDRLCRARGVALRQQARARSIDPARRRVEIDAGWIHADALVIAPGPFAKKLLASLPLRAVPQSVAYYAIDGGPALPVWASFEAELHYGLPDVGAGAKVARHATAGQTDPDYLFEAEEAELGRVDAFVRDRLVAWPKRIAAEACWYTMAPGEDFVMDLVAPGVAVGAGLSGHGFKLGPLVGRIVARLALDGASGSPLFEAHRARFSATRPPD